MHLIEMQAFTDTTMKYTTLDTHFVFGYVSLYSLNRHVLVSKG